MAQEIDHSAPHLANGEEDSMKLLVRRITARFHKPKVHVPGLDFAGEVEAGSDRTIG